MDPAQARKPASPLEVTTSLTVLPFGQSRATIRTGNGQQPSPERKDMPFVIPLETSVVGTRYDSPFG